MSFAYKRKRDDSRKDAKHAKLENPEDILNFAPWRLGEFVMRNPAYANSIPATVLKF